MYRIHHTDGGRRVTGLAISAKRRIDPVLTRRVGDPVRANKDVAIHHRLLNARCGSRPIWIGALGTTSAYCKLEQDASREIGSARARSRRSRKTKLLVIQAG
jgi:hypothetical protein